MSKHFAEIRGADFQDVTLYGTKFSPTEVMVLSGVTQSIELNLWRFVVVEQTDR